MCYSSSSSPFTILINIIIITKYPYNNEQGHGTICSFKFLDDNVPHLSIRPYNACGDYHDGDDVHDNVDNDDNNGTLFFSITFIESG